MNDSVSKVGPHWRIPWRNDEPQQILVHCRFDQLKGTYRTSSAEVARGEELYLRAKRFNNHDAAAMLVDELLNQNVVDMLVDAVLEIGKPCRVIFPHPEFDSDEPNTSPGPVANAIPFAFAAQLATMLGGEIETSVVEYARPGRTKLNRFQRFIWQPRFVGEISTEVAYVLVDDNCTLGGTLAMLRTHLVGNGGTIAGVCSLSTSTGTNCRFGIAEKTLDVLISTYGRPLSPLWIEEIGHDITCLTESEGSFLASWDGKGDGPRATLLQRLRNRLDKAKAKGK